MNARVPHAHILQTALIRNQREVDGSKVLGRTKEGFWAVLRRVTALGGWRGLIPLWSSLLQNLPACPTSHNQSRSLK